MISKIQFLKNFGIFNDFNWSTIPGIEDFKEKNIIYGWNYSGKTTLSRVFTCLRDKKMHPDYDKSSFKLTYAGIDYDNSSLETFPGNVMVFNAEYIRENLRWEYDEHISAISFEVGDNAKISTEINGIATKIEDIVNEQAKFTAAVEEFRSFEQQFTNEAGRIKNEVFSSLIEFNKGHLKRILVKIIDNLDQHIIKDNVELAALGKAVRIEAAKPRLNEVVFNSQLNIISETVKKIAVKVPSKNQVITILDENYKAFKWVQAGVSLHDHKNECLFCGNDIDEERFKKLKNYFQNEASEMKQAIENIEETITAELMQISDINFPSSINDLNDSFQDVYQKAIDQVQKNLAAYRQELGKIVEVLQKKLAENLYSAVETNLDETLSEILKQSIEKVSEIIRRNNAFTDDFDNIIEKERARFQNHLVANFLKETEYVQKNKSHDDAVKKINEQGELIKDFRQQINRLEALRQSNAEGCAQFNAFVQSFLSRNDIEVKLNEESQKFNLLRGSQIAKNLSEGEKMAIAFSHFLVNLKSLEQKKQLKNYIVYIDDPISSLDSNHIFQINSLLKDVFFEKVPNPQNPGQLMWAVKCCQLFISTHNFEFFTLLKELPTKTYKRDSHYFISRQATEAVIEKLPAVYNSSSSEYHFLFAEIAAFDKEKDKAQYPRLMMMPNILRRFTEMYTLIRYPNSKEEVDVRAEKVFTAQKSKRILKVFHYFSHLSSIDRINKHSEFIADIGEACNELLVLIKEGDLTHYEALEASMI